MTILSTTETRVAPAQASQATRTSAEHSRRKHDAAPSFFGRRTAQERRSQEHEAPRPRAASVGLPEPPPPMSMGGLAREKRLADVPRKYRGFYQRAWAGTSRKSAIRAFCLECAGWSESEVLRCTSTACPLFAFRKHG